MIAMRTHAGERLGQLARRIRAACLARPELLRNLLALVAFFSVGIV
jgi:hypothetical protein